MLPVRCEPVAPLQLGTPHRRTSVRPAVTSGQGLHTMHHVWPHTGDRRREGIRRLRKLLDGLMDGRRRERTRPDARYQQAVARYGPAVSGLAGLWRACGIPGARRAGRPHEKLKVKLML